MTVVDLTERLNLGRVAANRLMRSISRVPDPRQWPPLVRELCETFDPDELAEALYGLVFEAVAGDSRAGWLATAQLLCGDGLPYATAQAIYRAAVERELTVVRMILLAGEQAHRTAHEREFRPDDLLGSLTLGERKAMARRRDPELLDRLVGDGDPAVIDILLGNPRTTEAQVVRLASRRPNRARVLAQVGRAHGGKWLAQSAVQRALVLNPYAPVKMAVALAPLLPRQALREVKTASGLNPLVTGLAGELLALGERAAG